MLVWRSRRHARNDLAGREELVRHVPADYPQREASLHSLATAYVDEGGLPQVITLLGLPGSARAVIQNRFFSNISC
jgi:hypothetical protein